ncbi:DUF1564 family protein [Leptospira sp. 201903070]|uniref:DUF1564 family protein n=1 Tax=Leptospira ainlahdjerensis TaxID=2810033 RepID=A0ABS2UGU9_9LEPT|nr:DUF1564 family protein [Leptospira ainlahdjerensis]
MRGIKNLDKNATSSFLKGPKITCSLLIPSELIRKLSQSERKNLGKNIDFLLKRYGKKFRINQKINQNALTIKYQKAGNSLIKINSRILPEEWATLSILASAHGISRCFLYCILLQIFISDRSKAYSKMHPYIPSLKIESFIWSMDLKTKTIKRIFYQENSFDFL